MLQIWYTFVANLNEIFLVVSKLKRTYWSKIIETDWSKIIATHWSKIIPFHLSFTADDVVMILGPSSETAEELEMFRFEVIYLIFTIEAFSVLLRLTFVFRLC